MSKNIFEENPTSASNAPGKNSLEKQASQLAYDTKYKVKQSLGKNTSLNPAQVAKAYLTQLSKSPAPPAVKLLARKKLIGDKTSPQASPTTNNEEYIDNLYSVIEESIFGALRAVFVDGVEYVEEYNQEDYLDDTGYIQEFYSKVNSRGERVYHIRVTDKSTGNTYTRDATRKKIAELRANPNISSVEMTTYNKDSDDESKRGTKTASVKSGKGLDPVGKEDSDINNDGKSDKTDKYLLNRRKVRTNAIKGKDKKKDVSEEFIGEVKNNIKGENKKITGTNVDNYSGKNSTVNLKPEVSEQASNTDERRQLSTLQRFRRDEDKLNKNKFNAMKTGKIPVGSVRIDSYEMDGEQLDEKITSKTDMGDAIRDFQSSDSPQLSGRSKEERRQAAIAAVLNARRTNKESCDYEDEDDEKKKSKEQMDSREIPTKVNLVKNKMRAMGLKMSYEPEGEVIDELRRSEREGMGSPEIRTSGGRLVSARTGRREKGSRGGRHFWSGGQGGAKEERGKKKNEPGSQHQRLNPPEKPKRRSDVYSKDGLGGIRGYRSGD